MNNPDEAFGQLRARAEAALRAADPIGIAPGAVARVFHDLDVYHAELAIQNEELGRSREALSAAHDRYRALFDNAPVSFLSVSEQGVLLNANAEAANLLGRPRDLIIGRPVLATLPGGEALSQVTRRTLATRLPQRIETVIVRGASEERHLVVDARPNASDSGVEVVLAMTDVTALREAERARRDLEQRAMQSEKVETVARVAASVAHDVNNLLAAVTSIAEYARDVGSATPADLGAILDACQRGSRLMRALLGMANVSSAPPRTVNVVRIAQSVAAVLMRSRTARVRLDLPAQPLLVRGNEDAFYQSLFNVCVNGIDAMSGEGELRVCLGLSPNGDRVVVRVIDQGAGIPPEIQSRVFEPLFTTRAHTGGTGLGLAIAQRALTRYGATIELRSTVGVGTEVELTFERVDEAVKPEVASAPCNIAGVSVLFVDDDDRVRTAMGRVLRAMRCRVQEHGEGSAALATLGAERTFDVALVDVNMPDMSGAELARVLFDRYGPFPLVFVTGATGEIVPAAMLARAFVGMVRKPCTGAELAEAIHAALAAAPLAERVLSRRAEAV